MLDQPMEHLTDEFWKTAEKFRGNMWEGNNLPLKNIIWSELEKV